MKEIDPLLRFAGQARQLKETIIQSSEVIRDSSKPIGSIEDPNQFILTVASIRGANRPLVDKIRLASEQFDGIARQIATTVVSEPSMLERLQNEKEASSRAVTVVEEGVREKTLPEELLGSSNITHFRQRFEDLGLIIELYERGMQLGVDMPSGVTLTSDKTDGKPRTVRERVKPGPLEDIRRDLRQSIVVDKENRKRVTFNDEVIDFQGKANRAVLGRLIKDLQKPWGDSLGVYISELVIIAERNGYQGEYPGSDNIKNLNAVFDHHGLKIRIGTTPDPENRRFRYYRFKRVEQTPTPPPAPPIQGKKEDTKGEEDDFLLSKIQPFGNYQRLSHRVLATMNGADDEARSVFRNYLESVGAYPVLNSLHSFASRDTRIRQMTVGEVGDYKRNASSYLNEWLCYGYLYPIFLEKGLVLISPLGKFDLIRNAHRFDKPQRRVIEDWPGINPELEGVSSPDGYVIKAVPEQAPTTLEVVSVAEFKILTTEDNRVDGRIVQQHADYTPDKVASTLGLNNHQHPEMSAYLGRLCHRLDSKLPLLPLTVSPDLTIIYAGPKDNRSLPVKDIKPVEVPIFCGQVGMVINELLNNIK